MLRKTLFWAHLVVGITIGISLSALIVFNLILVYNAKLTQRQQEEFEDRVERYCLSEERRDRLR